MTEHEPFELSRLIVRPAPVISLARGVSVMHLNVVERTADGLGILTGWAIVDRELDVTASHKEGDWL